MTANPKKRIVVFTRSSGGSSTHRVTGEIGNTGKLPSAPTARGVKLATEAFRQAKRVSEISLSKVDLGSGGNAYRSTTDDVESPSATAPDTDAMRLVETVETATQVVTTRCVTPLSLGRSRAFPLELAGQLARMQCRTCNNSLVPREREANAKEDVPGTTVKERHPKEVVGLKTVRGMQTLAEALDTLNEGDSTNPLLPKKR